MDFRSGIYRSVDLGIVEKIVPPLDLPSAARFSRRTENGLHE